MLNPEQWLEKALKFAVMTRGELYGLEPGVFKDEHVTEVTIEKRGTDSWAVCQGGACLDKEDLDFEHEPLPSGTTADYKKRCRFKTKEEAWECFEKAKPHLLKSYKRGKRS